MDVNLAGASTRVLTIEDSSQIGHARRTVQQLAEQIGFDATDAGRAALLATELTSNILKHAERGALHVSLLRVGDVGGIELIAVDRGPGFELADCVPDGFSTGGTQGIGLGAVLRLAQVFDVYADARGAVVLARLYPRGPAVNDPRFGVSQHALHDDPACGDTWRLAADGRHLSALVIDGLGHGPEAENAAQAGAAAFDLNALNDPTELMDAMYKAMHGTRGGAAAIARYDIASGTVRFAGIGNIFASVVTAESSRGLASHPGIVGGQYRIARSFEYPHARGQLLIMHSDGLQSRWNLRDYPGLWHRHPSVIATVLHRDFARGRDDATILVVSLEAFSV
jgi:anti-sigma regulatory factor (Ser/Thr protein kinase)